VLIDQSNGHWPSSDVMIDGCDGKDTQAFQSENPPFHITGLDIPNPKKDLAKVTNPFGGLRSGS